MFELSAENWMAILFFIIFCIWGISIFLFGRITVKHLEREMAKEGLEQPLWDKGIGSVGVTYALLMVFSKLNPTIVDVEAVRRHTRAKDKKLAMFYIISMFLTFFIAAIVYYLYIP